MLPQESMYRFESDALFFLMELSRLDNEARPATFDLRVHPNGRRIFNV